jgi:hypothetical protein
MGEMGNAYKILVGKPERKRPLGKLTRRWEDNIRMDLEETECEGAGWIHLAQIKDQRQALINTVITFRFHKRQGIS